jgi:hypothetical protein
MGRVDQEGSFRAVDTTSVHLPQQRSTR